MVLIVVLWIESAIKKIDLKAWIKAETAKLWRGVPFEIIGFKMLTEDDGELNQIYSSDLGSTLLALRIGLTGIGKK